MRALQFAPFFCTCKNLLQQGVDSQNKWKLRFLNGIWAVNTAAKGKVAASTRQTEAGTHNWETEVSWAHDTASQPRLSAGEKKRCCEGPTVMDDAVLKQSLAQVDAFLRVPRLANLHQPGHKLTARRQKVRKIKHFMRAIFTNADWDSDILKRKKKRKEKRKGCRLQH